MTLQNHTRLWLGALGLISLLTALPASAQDLRGMQLFAQAEVSPYGNANGLPPKEGFFFVWDHLVWQISKPDVVVLGNTVQQSRIVYNVQPDPGVGLPVGWTQTNTHNTSGMQGSRTEGDRIEFGRMFKKHGWLFSAYQLKTQKQRLAMTHVGIVFADDPTWGVPAGSRLTGPVYQDDTVDPPVIGPNLALPLIFDDVLVENRVKHWSVELMGVLRTRQMHSGGYLEFFGGVRYMIFDEEFAVNATFVSTGDAAVDAVRDILGNSHWNTEARNHLIGPQVGFRWFRKRGRWMLSTESRLFAAVNQQSIRQQGQLGDQLGVTAPGDRVLGQPAQMETTNFNHAVFQARFSPVAEVRIEGRYQFSRSVSGRAGWTGLWMDRIGRPSNMVDYSLRNDGVMGVLAGDWQTVFMNGLTLGIDVNR